MEKVSIITLKDMIAKLGMKIIDVQSTIATQQAYTVY